MKKTLLSAAFAAALLAPMAQAAIVTSWDVGTWTRFNLNPATIPNPVGPGTINIPGVDPACGTAGMNCISDQKLRWGTPASSGGQSGIDITNGGDSATPYVSTPVITNGAAANNVIITHFNQPITGTSLDSVTILSSLYLTPVVPAGSTAGPIGPVTFAINFQETPNGDSTCQNGFPNGSGVNINGCGDIFVIDKASLNFPFWYDVTNGFDPTGTLGYQKYFLSFFERTGGFQPLQGPAGNLSAPCTNAGASYPCLGFVTPEAQNTPAQFAVTITTTPITIPEPGTLGLLGIALTGLALSRRRRKI